MGKFSKPTPNPPPNFETFHGVDNNGLDFLLAEIHRARVVCLILVINDS